MRTCVGRGGWVLSRDIFSCEPKYERSQSGANDFQDAHARELAACLPPRVVPHAPASERAWVCTACLCAYEAFNDGYGSPRSGRTRARGGVRVRVVCGLRVLGRHTARRQPRAWVGGGRVRRCCPRRRGRGAPGGGASATRLAPRSGPFKVYFGPVKFSRSGAGPRGRCRAGPRGGVISVR